ncbi:MAG: nitronate monooxygenase [Deltaproteobacteria bacterium]|nr:nitronate monooxygenase [Deltaproteobacteria bacterium]
MPTYPSLHTRICDLLGVRYPIVQTGMGWVSGADLTAATSAAGGFGILAAATMTEHELDAAIRAVRERTDAPFGVNMRADQQGVERTADLVIRHRVALASFAGPPKRDLIQRLRDGGVLTMPTIGAPRHAAKMADWGVDAVIAQGHEGGGHTGPIPTSLLLPAACRATDIPVLGAGGFNSGRGLVAALAYGAAGIAMGTRFLLTRESTVPDHIKAQYLKASLTDTVVTHAIDGAPQRVIRTPVIDRLERAHPLLRLPRALANALGLRHLTKTSLVDFVREGFAMRKSRELTWSQLAMAANAPMLTRASMVDGAIEVGILPTGQVVGVIEELPSVADVLAEIMREAGETLARLVGEDVVVAPRRERA